MRTIATFIVGVSSIGTFAVLNNPAAAAQEPASQPAATSQPAAAAPSEPQKIERLIQTVAELKDAKFIRNGSEYDAKQAAEHLRRKWQAAGDKVSSAEQFIDLIASKSSAS